MARIFFMLAALALTLAPAGAATRTAIFAGGCFWCVESDFDAVPGVISTTSGYIGGNFDNPTYHNHKGFREAVEIKFNDSRVSYERLVEIFLRSVDVTDNGGQFCDRGHAYTTAIYAVGAEQKRTAKAVKAAAQKELGRNIVTPVISAGKFWDAEGYHQNYYQKNPGRYKYYRSACGRDGRVKSIWGSSAYSGIPTH